MTSKYQFGLFLAVALAAWPHPARAMDDSNKEAIRSLSNQAAADFQQGQYEAAREKFSRAYEIAKVPKLAVWAARANEKLGHLVTAYELYRQALSLEPNDLWKGDVQQQAQKDAQQELDKLQPRIPKLTIVVESASATDVSVKMDDVQVPSALLGIERLADPGQRQIVGQRGDEVVSETATLAEGENKQVVLKFRKEIGAAAGGPARCRHSQPAECATRPASAEHANQEPLAQPSTRSPRVTKVYRSRARQRTLGWVGVGVGAAGLAFGATTGIYVALKYGDLNSEMPESQLRRPAYV